MNLHPRGHTRPLGASRACSGTSTGLGGLCISSSIPPPSCCQPAMLLGHGCTRGLLFPLPLNYFGFLLELQLCKMLLSQGRMGGRRRVMPCLGIRNVRAKYAERKEENNLPVARCPSKACWFSIFFFSSSSLSSWLQFTQKEEGREEGESKSKAARAARPAPLPCRAGWLRGAARARRC